MKLYLAVRIYDSFNHGEFEFVDGVFSSAALAASCLANKWKFSEAIQKAEFSWRAQDGEDAIYYEVRECELDKEIE